MKHQKKIIDQLIEQSKPVFQSSKFVKRHVPTEQFSEQTLDLQTNTKYQQINDKMQKGDPQLCSFQVFIEIGDGRSDSIIMCESSDPLEQAQRFCKKHNLDHFIIGLLAESLAHQMNKEKRYIKNSVVFSQTNGKKCFGADKVFSQSRMYKSSKHSKQLWKQPEQIFDGHPKINEVSIQIVKKMGGKEKIIQSVCRKFQQKAHNLVVEQFESEQRQFQSYPFQPLINPISREVDQAIGRNSRERATRYQHLYQQHKSIENKKEILRRNSISQISFKPAINKVSRSIMNRKRSLGDIQARSISKDKIQIRKRHRNQNRQETKRKLEANREANPNTLCHHLFDEAKRRQTKLQKQAQRIYNDQSNWHIIENSNSLIFHLRENRIKEIFHNLAHPQKDLHYQDIKVEKLNEVEKIFLPVFKEMQEIDTSLNEEEFVQAGLRLLKYITPSERALLIRRPSRTSYDKQNDRAVVQVNKKSKQILKGKGYGQQNIYMRGLIFKNQIKNQIQKGKQQKVRHELRTCTFKPKIHSVPQSIAY